MVKIGSFAPRIFSLELRICAFARRIHAHVVSRLFHARKAFDSGTSTIDSRTSHADLHDVRTRNRAQLNLAKLSSLWLLILPNSPLKPQILRVSKTRLSLAGY